MRLVYTSTSLDITELIYNLVVAIIKYMTRESAYKLALECY